MAEVDLMRKIQIELSKIGARIFRNNVALAWIGKCIRVSEPTPFTLLPGDVLIREARPLHAGLIKDSSDLVGWDADSGKFVAVEVKSPGEKPTKEQLSFLYAVHHDGGISIWADSVEEAVKKYIEAKTNGHRF